MKSSARNIKLNTVDDLFSTEESRQDESREKIIEISLSDLHPFKNHPFKVLDDEHMQETVDSITYLDELQSKADEIRKEHAALGNRRNEINRRIDEIVTLRKHILNYRKTRDVYVAYRKAGYSKKFYAEHATEIEMHKQAKRAFDEMNVSKLPSLRALQDEQARLSEERSDVNVAYQKAHREMRDLLTAKANLERVLIDKTESTPVQDRQHHTPSGQ